MVFTKRPKDHGYKLYGVPREDNTVRDPTACEEMEHCHFFESKMLIEVMRSLKDVNIYDKEDDMEADIGLKLLQ